MDEPSLLDYLKERLNLRRLLKGGGLPSQDERSKPASQGVQPEQRITIDRFPWRSLSALFLALIGQRFFEPGAGQPNLGIGFYLVAGGLLILALVKKEWTLKPIQADEDEQISSTYRRTSLLIFVPLFLISFFTFSGNQFTSLNIFLWIVTFIAAMAAFWLPENGTHRWVGFKQGVHDFFQGGKLGLHLNWWNLLVVIVFMISAWFHLSQLNSVPLEMTSDHTEKLLDVNEVLNGNLSIFFPRNSGREPIQFYLTAALVKYFGMDMGFTTLKLGMALAFLFSLYYVYRLGKEVGNRWTGLLAMLLIGFASWTNILARSGMRLVLTPVFVTPTLFYLFRGLRQARRNDMILAGIFLGLGLLGYSAYRILPVVVILVFIIYFFHHKSANRLDGLSGGFGVLVLFSLVAALPLLRYAIQYPGAFTYRMATRMTGAEQAINGPVVQVFLQNTVKALTMPFWRDGNTWVISVTNRPALDVVTAVFYLLGVVLLLYTWVKKRNWQYMALLLSIPVLMLPSILALAFPTENPSLSRAGGAVIPIIVVAAIALESLLSSLWRKAQQSGGKLLVVLLAAGLLLVSARQNYDLVFHQYNLQYQNATWNTSKMGKIAREYIDSIGSPDTIWVVAVPYWVDTRLVAINAGELGRDYAIWADDLDYTLNEPGTKLFFVKADDREGMTKLMQLYPGGFSKYYTGLAPGREFFTYTVPPAQTGQFVK